DSRETGKLTPDGHPDPSIFSTPFSREGIRLGTAIGLFVRQQPQRGATPQVRYRDFWGTRKRAQRLESLDRADFAESYAPAVPTAVNGFSLRPWVTRAAYRSWPKITELCSEEPISGLQEMRRGRLIGIDRDALDQRIRAYFNPDVAWESVVAERLGPV